jgi:hypothetical protein
MPEPRRHHSVPHFLLQGFAKKKGRVWQTHVFDKRDGRKFMASTRDIMVERDFNAIKTEAGVVSLEGYISRLEDLAAPIVRRLIEAQSASILTPNDRENIALFVALQLVRGTGYRAHFIDIAKQFRDTLIKRGMPVDDPQFEIPDDQAIKLEALHEIATALPMYAGHLHAKDMVVFKAPMGHEFIIGDNPVSLDNHKQFAFRGNLGLAVEGVEIYLPLTKSLTLGIWANDLKSEMSQMTIEVEKRNAHLKVRALLGVGQARAKAQHDLKELNAALDDAKRLVREVEAGGPSDCHPENMERFNSMQIGYAERYLASHSGNFDLAENMIAERPEIRLGGARGTVS